MLSMLKKIKRESRRTVPTCRCSAMRIYQRLLALLVGMIIISVAINNLPSLFKSKRHNISSFSRHKAADIPCDNNELNDFLKDIHRHSSRNILLETNITLKSLLPGNRLSAKSWKSFIKESYLNKSGKRVKVKSVKLKRLKTRRKSKRKKEMIRKEDKEKKKKKKTELKYDLIYLNNHNIKRQTPDENEENQEEEHDAAVVNKQRNRPVYRISQDRHFNNAGRDENDITSVNPLLNRMQKATDNMSAESNYGDSSWETRRGYETPSDQHNNRVKKRKKKKHRVKKKKDNTKPSVLLAVGILSKLSALDRRNGIRETWMKSCLQRSSKVTCRFFTDEIRVDTENREKYLEEKQQNNDLEYMPYRGGYNFALRLLWMFKYYTEHYNFDYFLRIDDDYFLCIERLLKELPHRPSPIYWGWIHCEPGIVRVDEGWMILSSDIIDEILERANTSLMCHPYGDQAVAHWLQESELDIIYFMDNRRIIHQEVTSRMGNKYLVPDICQRYLGLHGTYPDYMRKYWALITDKANKQKYGRHYKIRPIKPFEELCFHDKTFSFQLFDDPYYAEPKPCKDNPVFINTDRPFEGREHRRTELEDTLNGGFKDSTAYERRKMLLQYDSGNYYEPNEKVVARNNYNSNDELKYINKNNYESHNRLNVIDKNIGETSGDDFSVFDGNR